MSSYAAAGGCLLRELRCGAILANIEVRGRVLSPGFGDRIVVDDSRLTSLRCGQWEVDGFHGPLDIGALTRGSYLASRREVSDTRRMIDWAVTGDSLPRRAKLGRQWAIVHLQTLTHRASRPTINAETHETLVLPLLRQLLSEAWQGEARMIAVRLRTARFKTEGVRRSAAGRPA